MEAQATPTLRTKTVLTAKQMFQLTNLVSTEYVKSGLTDLAFAELASKHLECAVSESSVATARKTLDLVSNRDRAREIAKATNGFAVDHASYLQRQIDELRAELQRQSTIIEILRQFAQKAGATQDLSGLQFRVG